MKPVVSVIIPTYKRPVLLEKCLTALNRQRFPGKLFEVLVVTDGPESQACDMLKKIPACFSLHVFH